MTRILQPSFGNMSTERKNCAVCSEPVLVPLGQSPPGQEFLCHLCFQKGVIWAAKRAKEEQDANEQKEREIVSQVPLCGTTGNSHDPQTQS